MSVFGHLSIYYSYSYVPFAFWLSLINSLVSTLLPLYSTASLLVNVISVLWDKKASYYVCKHFSPEESKYVI